MNGGTKTGLSTKSLEGWSALGGIFAGPQIEEEEEEEEREGGGRGGGGGWSNTTPYTNYTYFELHTLNNNT
jgi:hypothetical protein